MNKDMCFSLYAAESNVGELKTGLDIGSLELEFSKHGGYDAINCRADVKAVIDVIGLDHEPVIYGDSAEMGTQSNIADKLPEELFTDEPLI